MVIIDVETITDYEIVTPIRIYQSAEMTHVSSAILVYTYIYI